MIVSNDGATVSVEMSGGNILQQLSYLYAHVVPFGKHTDV